MQMNLFKKLKDTPLKVIDKTLLGERTSAKKT